VERRARILTVLTYYHPHWTGLTAYARSIAEGLAARGHDVTVLTSQHDRSLATVETIDRVRVRRLPTVGRVSRAMMMPSFPTTFRAMLDDHDVVHIHTPMPEAALLVAMAHARDTPVLITHQGDVVMPSGTLNRMVQGAMDVTLTTAVKRADAVVTHSADYARRSRLLTRRSGPVWAIAPPTLIPEPDRGAIERWRSELGLLDRRLVGFAGRFVEEKGFDYLLQAVPSVLARVPDAHFVFAGETDVAYERFYDRCRPMLERHAGDITSVGLLRDRQQMADFYGMCDVFALPSRSDCFAGVQVEALLCGTPLVTADIAGARETVHRTGMGRLVAARDPDALAAGIVDELCSHRPTPRREDVLKHYDPAEAVDRYSRLIGHVVGSSVGTSTDTAVPDPTPPTATTTTTRQRWSLSAQDADALERALANEADMAYRRRVPRLMGFLDLHDGEAVLDFGAGMGALSMLAASIRDLRITAVDRDIDRLGWGIAEHVPSEAVVADGRRLPFSDATFDKVIAAEVLEHLDDDVAGLRELYRVLRPSGVVAISVPHANYPFAWDPIGAVRDSVGIEPVRDGRITGQWSGHHRLYLPAELREAIEAVGFVVEALEEQTPYAVPLNHLLVYSIGKPLIEAGALPERLQRSASRFRPVDGRSRRLDPIAIGVRSLRIVDRRNERPRGDETRFVGIVARAVKPGP